MIETNEEVKDGLMRSSNEFILNLMKGFKNDNEVNHTNQKKYEKQLKIRLRYCI